MNRIIGLIKEILGARGVVRVLAVNDFKNRYIGSYFGLSWAIIQSLVTFVLYWVVFEFFLKAKAVSAVPFALWLMAGLVPWMFFSDALVNSTSTFQNYAFIVKKMTFKISVLPLAKILSSFFMNLILNTILLAIYAIFGYLAPIHLLDIIYYNVCMLYLLVGMAFILSTVNVFFRDLAQLVGILVQIGTWATPVLWSFSTVGLPAGIQWVLKINPMYYIVDGYRHALIDHGWFFDNIGQMGLFWAISTLIFLIGTTLYVRLRSHFADVL